MKKLWLILALAACMLLAGCGSVKPADAGLTEETVDTGEAEAEAGEAVTEGAAAEEAATEEGEPVAEVIKDLFGPVTVYAGELEELSAQLGSAEEERNALSERIAELKAQVANGTYSVSDDDLAEQLAGAFAI